MFYEPTCIKTGENLHASRRITKYFRFKRGISISEGCFGGKNSTETEITRNFKNLRFSNILVSGNKALLRDFRTYRIMGKLGSN